MELQVPQSQRRTIKGLLSSKPERLAALISALRTIRPSMSMKDSAALVARQAGVDEREAIRILVMLAGLFSVRDRPSADRQDIVAQVVSAIESDQDFGADE